MDYFSRLLLPNARLAALVLVPTALYIVAYIQRKRSRLDEIPTMGYSGIITSWVGSVTTLFNAHRLIQEGYEKHRIFKIPYFSTWLVLVNGSDYMRDVWQSDEDKLSFHAAADDVAQFQYTVAPELGKGPAFEHTAVARGPMTRSIPQRIPDIVDEVGRVFANILAEVSEDWTDVSVYPSVVQIISRVSARFFVGPKLSSNQRYLDIMQGFTFHVAIVAIAVRVLPGFLKTFVSDTVFRTPDKVREVEDFLRSVIDERLESKDFVLDDTVPKDMLTWLLYPTPDTQRSVRDIAVRMILINVAAIHTTSTLLTHVLFNLAAYPEYIEPLREEIATVMQEEGWTKAGVDKMHRLDSFMKETQRLHGCDAIVMIRKAMKDFQFYDGTFVPKGTDIAVTNRAINHDERIYPDPQEFKGFRFIDEKLSNRQMTALTSEYMSFGIGRHACPGRFFVVTEVKTIVAQLLLAYDVKLSDEQSGRPKGFWWTGVFAVPHRSATIALRKRKM